MYLTRHHTSDGPRWAVDGQWLPADFRLNLLLQLPQAAITSFVQAILTEGPASGDLLPPVESAHEVWACGVTYLRSREAREAESEVRDVYQKVYHADRPELFFKSVGWRVVGHGTPIRIRKDSHWNVPEPELTLVINSDGEIVGYSVGDDVSSRDIEGENPLYLPQAKMYNGACAVGPGILLTDADTLRDLPVHLEIERDGAVVFEGDTSIAQMKRSLEELVHYLTLEMDFPNGALLMTGTGIVPTEAFSLTVGDTVNITIGDLTLSNPVTS